MTIAFEKSQTLYRAYPLDNKIGDKMVDFWADAVAGLVRLGRGSTLGEQIIMEWQDPTPHEVCPLLLGY